MIALAVYCAWGIYALVGCNAAFLKFGTMATDALSARTYYWAACYLYASPYMFPALAVASFVLFIALVFAWVVVFWVLRRAVFAVADLVFRRRM